MGHGVGPNASYAGASDTMLQEAAPAATYGAGTVLTTDRDNPAGTGKSAEALFRWDISAIPAGSTVQAVTLTFNVQNPTSGHGVEVVYGLARA